MNLNKRELNEHVEFESQTYYAAFAAELEACAQPMWGLLSHCKVRVRLTFLSLFLFLLMIYSRVLKSERSAWFMFHNLGFAGFLFTKYVKLGICV